MGLTAVLDALTDYLRVELSPAPALLGGTEPDALAQLPAVTLSLGAVTIPRPGIGATPRATVTGALAVSASIDLAGSYPDFPDGRAVQLPDRKILQLPHGSLVRRDGSDTPPLLSSTQAGKGDITVTVTSANKATVYKAVAGTPSAAAAPPEVVVDPAAGRLRFGAALPATGKVDATYFVGSWDVRSETWAGDLRIDAFARDVATADSLSRRLETALAPERVRRIAGLRSLAATSWGPLAQIGSGALLGPDTRRRSLTYRFEYEREQPAVISSGGPIQRVRVQSTAAVGSQGATNQFDVI